MNQNGAFNIQEIVAMLEQQQQLIVSLQNRLDNQAQAHAQAEAIPQVLVNQIENQQAQIVALQNSIAQTPRPSENSRPAFKAPLPQRYLGKRDTEEIDSFTYQVKKYMKVMNVPVASQTALFGTLLGGKALTWWQNTCDAYGGEEKIAFDVAIDLLNEHYRKKIVKEEAERDLRNLKMKKLYHSYEEEFERLAQHIPDMGIIEKIRNFKAGLTDKYFLEVQLKHPQDPKKRLEQKEAYQLYLDMKRTCSAIETASSRSVIHTSSSSKSTVELMDVDALQTVKRSDRMPDHVFALSRKMPKPVLTPEEHKNLIEKQLCLGCQTKKHKGGWQKCYAYIKSLGPEFKPVLEHWMGFHKRH